MSVGDEGRVGGDVDGDDGGGGAGRTGRLMDDEMRRKKEDIYPQILSVLYSRRLQNFDTSTRTFTSPS